MPEAYRARVGEARETLVATVAEHDESLADRYLSEQAIGEADLLPALRRATLDGAVVPVLAGSAPPAVAS